MEKFTFSRRFTKSTDDDFKFKEFEKHVSDYVSAFVQCYPHWIKKEDIKTLPGEEIWKLTIYIDVESLENNKAPQE